MTFHVVGSLPLGGFNVAAAGSLPLLSSLTSQLDSMTLGPAGLGSVSSDLSIQFQASLSANLNIGLQLANPLMNIQLTLSNLANLQASLSAAANISTPTLQISQQLSANVALAAVLGAKLAGIQALIASAMAVKLPAVDFLSSLTSALAAGPVAIASWGFADPPDTLANTGAEIGTAFGAGFAGLLPTDTVYGVLLVTSEPSASVAISATLLVQ